MWYNSIYFFLILSAYLVLFICWFGIFCLFWVWVWGFGLCPNVFRIYFRLCAQESLLVVFKGTIYGTRVWTRVRHKSSLISISPVLYTISLSLLSDCCWLKVVGYRCWRDSKEGEVLALHTYDPDAIPGGFYGTMNTTYSDSPQPQS